ncbi:MAG TPA: hypothetical protein PLV68_20040, partial [Ilumatobacteraceae bacterium]|nr:hypothetical protein [Ilumatobacteraceae bacterium]
MTAVAAFDVDGTLTTRDSVVPFLVRVAGRARLAARMLTQPGALGRGIVGRDRDRIKAVAVRAA